MKGRTGYMHELMKWLDVDCGGCLREGATLWNGNDKLTRTLPSLSEKEEVTCGLCIHWSWFFDYLFNVPTSLESIRLCHGLRSRV